MTGPRTPHLGALGSAIARTRKQKGLSQEALGDLCEMQGTHISALERGIRNPAYETLRKVAAELGTTLADKLHNG
jgi:transcriptional regulator with XRE-family HTH domain